MCGGGGHSKPVKPVHPAMLMEQPDVLGRWVQRSLYQHHASLSAVSEIPNASEVSLSVEHSVPDPV